MVKVANEVVQAFPVVQRTYSGVANGFTDGGVILHVAEDCDITFDFGNSSVVLSCVAGQDLALDKSIESITSTGVVWIS